METKRIADLLDNGEQPWGALDEATYAALSADITANRGRLVVPVVLSARGRLIDGHHRLMAAAAHGRKTINETEWVIDRNAKDPETEVLAAIKYQQNRRQTTTADSAAVARQLMRRFGWSQGIVAKKLGVSAAAVSQWLKLNPDPDFQLELRLGADGKEYQVDAEAPKAKRIKATPKPGHEVVVRTNHYLAQLADPEFKQWILDHADADDYPELAENWRLIAKAAELVADALDAPHHGDNEPF